MTDRSALKKVAVAPLRAAASDGLLAEYQFHIISRVTLKTPPRSTVQ